MKNKKIVTETFPGQFASLAKISKFIKEATRSAGFSEEEMYAVELAADEAASNIVEHSYGGENLGDIICTCETTPGEITIIFEDHGKPFNPGSVPEMVVGVPLEDRPPGGAGLFLMKKLMDMVEFDFSPDSSNRLTMKKKAKQS